MCRCAIKYKAHYSMNNYFDKEGHRGCRGLMPENTIAAMIKAIDLNVTTLEMDVAITKDSQVVLSHDPWFNPEITTKSDGSFIDSAEPKCVLYQMNYFDIKKFDVGYKFYSKFPNQVKLNVSAPLLIEVIDSVQANLRKFNKQVFYNIEIKSVATGDNIYHPNPEKFVDLVMKIINQKHIFQQVIIQSFDIRSLKYLKIHYPQIKTSLLVNENDKRSLIEQISGLGFVPTIYSPNYSLVTSQLVKDCHKKNIKLIPWTINNLQQMKRLKNMGVDGLISDYPNLYQNL